MEPSIKLPLSLLQNDIPASWIDVPKCLQCDSVFHKTSKLNRKAILFDWFQWNKKKLNRIPNGFIAWQLYARAWPLSWNCFFLKRNVSSSELYRMPKLVFFCQLPELLDITNTSPSICLDQYDSHFLCRFKHFRMIFISKVSCPSFSCTFSIWFLIFKWRPQKHPTNSRLV